MKRFFKFYLPMIVAVAIISSCGNKYGSPVDIADLKEYKDDATEFSIKYPSNWVTSKIPGKRFAVFSSNDALSRFSKYESTGFPGAKIDFNVVMMDSTLTMDSIITINKMFSPELYKQDDIMIDGVSGKKFTYMFELEDGEFMGEMYIASKDNKAVSIIFIEAFADTWEKYKDNFNTIVSSIKLATEPKKLEPKVIEQSTEELPASETLVAKSGPGYVIMIPDNFNSTKGVAGGVISSQNYIGKRRADCNIQVDVIDASKSSNLKKIVEENKPTYKGSGNPQSTKLGGVDAYMFSYSPAGKVKGRVYFAIKGDKLFRLTINWFADEEAGFLPVFEKSIKSVKFE